MLGGIRSHTAGSHKKGSLCNVAISTNKCDDDVYDDDDDGDDDE